MPQDHTPATRRSNPERRQRSALTNGSAHFLDADGRSRCSRRLRDLTQIFVDAMGGDGLSEVRRLLARRAASMILLTEKMDSDLANGREIDVRLAVRCSRVLSTLLQQMGVIEPPTPKSRKVDRKSQDLESYLAERYGEGMTSQEFTSDGAMPNGADNNEQTRVRARPRRITPTPNRPRGRVRIELR